jgi:ribosomal protein L11 methyltransferase
MYSLRLTCEADEVDLLSGELWDAETAGIRELDHDGRTTLIAAFTSNARREKLLNRFAAYSPEWVAEQDTDWVAQTHLAWPARPIGRRLFLAPPWSTDPTPDSRLRIVLNPGLACGTGDHPCTQLALAALEMYVTAGCRVVDVGTGSGILAIAGLRLGAGIAIGIDPDDQALQQAKENFALNGLNALLMAGYADCFANAFADIVVANISATVLLAIADDLLRMLRPDGRLILTGFTEPEFGRVQAVFGRGDILEQDEWRCLALKT